MARRSRRGGVAALATASVDTEASTGSGRTSRTTDRRRHTPTGGRLRSRDVLDRFDSRVPVARAEVLIGGSSIGSSTPQWTAPGTSGFYIDPLGQESAQVPMPASTLRNLHFSVKSNVQDGGLAKARVYVNGNYALIGCTVNVVGECTSTNSVTINAGDLLAIKLVNELTSSGTPTGLKFTYSLERD